MEVVVPVRGLHFDSTASSPYVSAASSPKRFGDPFDYHCHYTSAPTSPARVAAIYAASSAVPFDWEEKPGTPKSKKFSGGVADDADDFAFDFSGQLEKGGLLPALTTADELFEEGKIRPLKLPPRLSCPVLDDKNSIASTPRSPKSPNIGLWSPRHRGKDNREGFDPFAAAMVEATRERGRERNPPSPSISSARSRKGSRSLSPMRGAGGYFQKSPKSSPSQASTTTDSTTNSVLKGGGGSKKWRLRDLLLFRSASEGRVTGNRSKDPLRKYTILSSSNSSASLSPPPPLNNKRGGGGEDTRSSSFRSTDSSGSMRRGSGPAISAHEMHYKSNRAASEELKKKTALPFRQGLFGCLRFNPAVHSIARGFQNSYSFTRRRS